MIQILLHGSERAMTEVKDARVQLIRQVGHSFMCITFTKAFIHPLFFPKAMVDSVPKYKRLLTSTLIK